MNEKAFTSDPEIQYLLRLLDDPDEEVYATVSEKIVSRGISILPVIMDFRDEQQDNFVIIRANNLIQTIRYQENFTQWENWKKQNGNPIEAIILIGRLLDNQFEEHYFRTLYNKLKQSLWLELNLYMSPLEVFHSVTSVIYSQYNIKVIDNQNVIDKKTFHPIYIFEKKIVNQYLFALLVTTILDELDTNIKAIKLPYQLLLVYFELQKPFKISKQPETIYKLAAYLDPKTAEVFSEHDIEMFFKKIDLNQNREFFIPLSPYQLTFMTIYDLYKMLENSNDEVLINHLKDIITHIFNAEIK